MAGKEGGREGGTQEAKQVHVNVSSSRRNCMYMYNLIPNTASVIIIPCYVSVVVHKRSILYMHL